MIKKGAQAFFLHYYAMERKTNERKNTNPCELEQLLGEHSDIFQNPPHGLPPPHSRNHVIELMPGSTPMRKKTYIQSRMNKSEIERLVQELLNVGIITRSKTPFFALFILVRKKYESYRVCIDYKALNKFTIKDKFPIRFVDELLDELHGTKYFSKLDLKLGYYQICIREGDVPPKKFTPTKV